MIGFRIVHVAVAAIWSGCAFVADASSYKNVYGKPLQSCSSSGMALTGYTRTGYCVDQNDDSGSHHICIDLSSATGGNFCDVTGQDDWCSSENMPCHSDDDHQGDDQQYCAIQNWCVCQWAFASYLENAGGCDMIQDIVCDAINEQAVKAYRKNASTEKFQNALQCLAERCGIDIVGSSTYLLRRGAFTLVFIAGVVTAAVYLYNRGWCKRGSSGGKAERLVLTNGGDVI